MKIQYSKPLKNTILKTLSALLFLTAFFTGANAQVNYGYDNNGNRFVSSVGVVPRAPVKHGDSTVTVKVYPNPTFGNVNVSISSFKSCEYATFYLSDATGKLLFTQKVTSTSTTLSLASYNQSTFYLKVIMCNNEYPFTLIKLTPKQGQSAPNPVLK